MDRSTATPAAPLPDWAGRREDGRRLLVHGWALTGAVTLVAGLLSERYLVVPALFGTATCVALAAGWARTRLWRWRRRASGHPVTRAAAPRSLARGRAQPAGWPETLVAGSVHVTGQHWQWQPGTLCTDDVEPRSWEHASVERLTFTPSWGPALPPSGYVRLELKHGGDVVLLVWDPDLLGLLTPLPEDSASEVEHRTG